MSNVTALVQKLKNRAELAKRVGAKNPKFTADEVLALVEALETKEEQRANWCLMAQKLGDSLDVSERRVAELEARTVTLPEEKFCPSEYAGSQYWEDTEVWNKAISACAVAIHTAGIPIKGE